METDIIVKSILVLLGVLVILVFLLFLEPKEKSPKDKKDTQTKKSQPKVVEKEKIKYKKEEPKQRVDLDYLLSVIKNKKSDVDKLSEALELVIKHHGLVHKKLGMRPHPDFDIYVDILFTICRHPNANKDMIIKFDRELARLNPEYKQEINESIERGLNSRRV
jgi:hypothetical protein